jgi:MFS family permease
MERAKPVDIAADNMRPGPGTRKQPRRRTVPKAVAFWILAGLFLILFFASSAASPLYRVYQAQFHFSAATLTAVFAVYVLVLLVTLLLFGSASDYLGRLPVIITALVFSAAACAVFLAAHGVGALYAARSLQGIAAGQGSFRMITALAEPNDRAGLVTAIYIVGYLAFSVPALIAGVATTSFGLHATALVYSASLAVLAAAAVGLLLLRPGAKPAGTAQTARVAVSAGPCTAPPCPQAMNPPDG